VEYPLIGLIRRVIAPASRLPMTEAAELKPPAYS
jgi:hypothetical protein